MCWTSDVISSVSRLGSFDEDDVLDLVDVLQRCPPRVSRENAHHAAFRLIARY
jgi:hypothetical protein